MLFYYYCVIYLYFVWSQLEIITQYRDVSSLLKYTFSFFQEFLKRFASIPDMLELDHLTVSGDVTFGKGVVLKVG